MDAGGPGRGLHLCAGGIGEGQADVLLGRIREDSTFLQNNCRLGEELLAGGAAHVGAAHAHAPVDHVPEPGHQPHQGGLARARRADDGGDRSGPQLKADIVDDERITLVVAERDMVEGDTCIAPCSSRPTGAGVSGSGSTSTG